MSNRRLVVEARDVLDPTEKGAHLTRHRQHHRHSRQSLVAHHILRRRVPRRVRLSIACIRVYRKKKKKSVSLLKHGKRAREHREQGSQGTQGKAHERRH